MPDVDPRAREDYTQALGAYELADRELDRARSTAQLEPVSRALEEGRYAMAAASGPPTARPPR